MFACCLTDVIIFPLKLSEIQWPLWEFAGAPHADSAHNLGTMALASLSSFRSPQWLVLTVSSVSGIEHCRKCSQGSPSLGGEQSQYNPALTMLEVRAGVICMTCEELIASKRVRGMLPAHVLIQPENWRMFWVEATLEFVLKV